MNVKLKIPEQRAVFAFGKDVAQVPAELQLTYFEDEHPPIAVTVRTLSQSVTVFLTESETAVLKTFLNSPEIEPGHCSDCD